MRKILLAAVIALTVTGCKNADKTTPETPSKNDDVKAAYEKNLATVKAFVAAFEKEDSNAMAALIADTAVWNSPAYGDTVHTKKHWVESLRYYMNNWDKLHLTNGQFLPGVDQVTNEFDGSVRYYGQWDGVHTTGVATRVSFYGTYDFNKDNKIINGSDFFDLGGLMNAIKPKGK